MKLFSSVVLSSQKVLNGIKNCISKPIQASRLKNLFSISRIQEKPKLPRVLFSSDDELENIPASKPESIILSASKKIQKTSTSIKPIKLEPSSCKASTDVTDMTRSVQEVRSRGKSSKKSKNSNPKSIGSIETPRRVLGDITNTYQERGFREIPPPSSAQLEKSFLEDDVKKTSNYSRQSKRFQCFRETDLNIPSEFTKTIPHSCDNDCATDDEQIRSAIKNLHRSIVDETHNQKSFSSLFRKSSKL